ncbi:MAG: class I SAM-dependent methyltransferase [Nocardioides sp.]
MRGELRDWDVRADQLAAASIADGRPTEWFDRLYAEGRAGQVSLPWDRTDPHPLLREWAEHRHLSGDGRRAVVVGCGLGADAAYLASLGFAVVGFDVSANAIEVACERHGGSGVDYRVADLLALPAEWRGAFDLVVEIFTVQALPDPPRDRAVEGVAGLVAEGGTLLAVAFRRVDGAPQADGPPYPLAQAEIEGLAAGALTVVRTEALAGERWRVEITRSRTHEDGQP